MKERLLERWHRLNRWLGRSPLVAYLILVLASAYAIAKVEDTADTAAQAIEQLRVEREASREEFQTALGTIVAVQVDNCESDRKFRVQYKIRGQGEKRLLQLFVDLARAQVEGATDPPPTPEETAQAEQFLADFEPLLDRIKIIPVPRCGAVDDRLRRDLKGTGAVIPRLSKGNE